MIGQTILHYKILEKLGEPACRQGRGGLVRRNRHNNNLREIW
jgi:hypothetical protein